VRDLSSILIYFVGFSNLLNRAANLLDMVENILHFMGVFGADVGQIVRFLRVFAEIRCGVRLF
jgi:hypothetical protein